MRAGIDAIKTGTRVLTALTEKRPDAADIQALRQFDEFTNGRDLDELACKVIQKAVRRRGRNACGGGPMSRQSGVA
jgi:hypothetical protein